MGKRLHQCHFARALRQIRSVHVQAVLAVIERRLTSNTGSQVQVNLDRSNATDHGLALLIWYILALQILDQPLPSLADQIRRSALKLTP
jgi:hypothetical protein